MRVFYIANFFIVLSSSRAFFVSLFYARGGPTRVPTRVSLLTLCRLHSHFPEGNFSFNLLAHIHTRAEASASTSCLQTDSPPDTTSIFNLQGSPSLSGVLTDTRLSAQLFPLCSGPLLFLCFRFALPLTTSVHQKSFTFRSISAINIKHQKHIHKSFM